MSLQDEAERGGASIGAWPRSADVCAVLVTAGGQTEYFDHPGSFADGLALAFVAAMEVERVGQGARV